LKKLGALDNTYVIYLSDNGGRGKMPIAGQAEHVSDQNRNYPLAGAKHSIYEGGLRVPFSISGPGIQAGSISHVPVSGVDILPTVADFAGYHKPFGAAVDGGSFKTIALATGDTVSREHPLVFHSEGGERPRNAQATKKDDKPIKQRFARAPTNW
jgi:arylsulfatase A